MSKNEKCSIINLFEKSYEEICSLESLIMFTQEVCLKKEIASTYYNLNDNERINLSEERNHYINMLSLSLEKISNIKNIHKNFEYKINEL